MAGSNTVHIDTNSPEHVALEMTRAIIIHVEGKRLSDITREEFLDTYSE